MTGHMSCLLVQSREVTVFDITAGNADHEDCRVQASYRVAGALLASTDWAE